MKPATGALWFAVVAAVFAAATALTVRSSAFTDGSFKAFYCAGKAILQRRDPYRVEPLRACQHAVAHEELPPAYVEPAPLPGFALAFFAVLALAPVKIAAAVFALAIAAATILTVLLLSALTRAPPAAVLAVLMPITLLNLALGEIPPFATLALCAAAYGVAMKRWTLAGIAASLSLVEPHVGLPAVAALLIFVPGTRIATIAGIVALAALSVATIGFAENIEYARAVLPAQAFSELVSSDQYSLSRVLYALGTHERLALMLGELSYAVMAVIGIALGRRAAALWNAPALIPLVPAASVLFGGVFMHDIQMIAAIPAALLVAAFVPANRRLVAFLALVFLAVVWTQHVSRSVILADAVAVIGAGVVAFDGGRRAAVSTALAVVFSTAALLLIGQFQPVVRATQVRTAPFSAAASELASTAWARYERATPALMMPRFYQQLPTWVGLLLLLACLAGAREPGVQAEVRPALTEFSWRARSPKV